MEPTCTNDHLYEVIYRICKEPDPEAIRKIIKIYGNPYIEAKDSLLNVLGFPKDSKIKINIISIKKYTREEYRML